MLKTNNLKNSFYLKFRQLLAISIILLFSQRYSLAQEQAAGRPLIVSFNTEMVKSPPVGYGFDPFYKKYADAFGIPIISSERVSDDALLIARDIINYMLLKRPDIREGMIKLGARLSIIGKSEMQTDLPECRDWKKPTYDDERLTPDEKANYYKPGGIAGMTDHAYWDQRARGMGGIQTSCAEENLLGYPGTRYFGENIMVHEFSHNIMAVLETIDADVIKQINASYERAKKKGLYKGQYAINTVAEYWAEGTQWWFWSNIEFYDGKIRIQSPEDLKAYDPTLYNLLDKVYAGHHIPGDVYYGKNINNKTPKK
ncbi:glycoside hydrolase [Mucilaginibacter sp. KACC 22063]|uniref:glycoside hydrolase n=1 Tax=Mucilaginibacter sp. KACC 22063 TaxID=3025666 RepID=UPI0023672F8F|nr:glycoside hydrolase [Mucilaginibacter sp. KACC 22063]WDF55846.1 glycoside hydrolase [Mucilaginibacter sp. KACC 22063]